MKLRITLISLFLLVGSFVNAQDTTNTKFGKGILNVVAKDNSWSLKLATRMQFLSTTDWSIDDGDLGKGETNFLVRRARLKFGGHAYTTKLKYKIELGLTNRDISGASEFTSNAPRLILDAVIKWNFYQNFQLWAGQTKLPGNRERVVSSANLQFVDRSRLNSRFNIDRDLGIQLRHKFKLSEKFVVKEALAISQGEGRNITTGNLGGHQYTSRVELLPFGEFAKKGDYIGSDLQREATPKLSIGVVFDLNHNAVKTRSNQGSFISNEDINGDTVFSETNVSTFFLDADFKYKGFSFMGEFANRNAADPIALDSTNTTEIDRIEVGNALNTQIGYLFKNNWEVAGRYTYVKFDNVVSGKNLEEQYTLGVSKYIKGHKLKVQSDVTYKSDLGQASGLQYRLQFDIHF